MHPLALFAFVVVAGCARGADADLPYIKQARSAAAEWALVNQQAQTGKLTTSYAKAMRAAARDEIETAAAGFTNPAAPYAAEAKALLAEPDDAAPAELRFHVDRLKHMEDGLESA